MYFSKILKKKLTNFSLSVSWQHFVARLAKNSKKRYTAFVRAVFFVRSSWGHKCFKNGKRTSWAFQRTSNHIFLTSRTDSRPIWSFWNFEVFFKQLSWKNFKISKTLKFQKLQIALEYVLHIKWYGGKCVRNPKMYVSILEAFTTPW